MAMTAPQAAQRRASIQRQQYDRESEMSRERALESEAAAREASEINQVQQDGRSEEKPGLIKRMWNAVKGFFSRLFSRKRNTETRAGRDITSDVIPAIAAPASSSAEELPTASTLTPEQNNIITGDTVEQALNTPQTQTVTTESEISRMAEEAVVEIPATDRETGNEIVVSEGFMCRAVSCGEELLAKNGTINILGEDYEWISEAGVSITQGAGGTAKSADGIIYVADKGCNISDIRVFTRAEGQIGYNVSGSGFRMPESGFDICAKFEQNELADFNEFSGSEMYVNVKNKEGTYEFKSAKVHYAGNRLKPEVTGAVEKVTELPPELGYIKPALQEEELFSRRMVLEPQNDKLVFGFRIDNYIKEYSVGKMVTVENAKKADGFFVYSEDGSLLNPADEGGLYHLYLMGGLVGPINLSEYLKGINKTAWNGENISGLKLTDVSIGAVKFSGLADLDFGKGEFMLSGSVKKQGFIDAKNINVTLDDDGFSMNDVDIELMLGGEKAGEDGKDAAAEGGEDEGKESIVTTKIHKLIINDDGINANSDVNLKNLKPAEWCTINGTGTLVIDKNILNLELASEISAELEDDSFSIDSPDGLKGKMYFSRNLMQENSTTGFHIGTVSGTIEGAVEAKYAADENTAVETSFKNIAFNNNGLVIGESQTYFDLEELGDEVKGVVGGKGSVLMENAVFTKNGIDKSSDSVKLYVKEPKLFGKQIGEELEIEYTKEEGFKAKNSLKSGNGLEAFKFGNNLSLSLQEYAVFFSKKGKEISFGMENANIEMSAGLFELELSNTTFGYKKPFKAEEISATNEFLKSAAAFLDVSGLKVILEDANISKENGISYSGVGLSADINKTFAGDLVEVEKINLLLTKDEAGNFNKLKQKLTFSLKCPGINGSTGTFVYDIKADDKEGKKSLSMVFAEGKDIKFKLFDYGEAEVEQVTPLQEEKKGYQFEGVSISAGNEESEEKSESGDTLLEKIASIMPDVNYGIDKFAYISEEKKIDISAKDVKLKSVKGKKDITDNLSISTDFDLVKNTGKTELSYEVEAPKGRSKNSSLVKDIAKKEFDVPICPALSANFSLGAYGGYTFSTGVGVEYNQNEFSGVMSANAKGMLGAKAGAALKLGLPNVKAFSLKAGLEGFGEAAGAAAVNGKLTIIYDSEKKLLDAFSVAKEADKTSAEYNFDANLSVGLRLMAGAEIPPIFIMDSKTLQKNFELKRWQLGAVRASGKLEYDEESKGFAFSKDSTFEMISPKDKADLFKIELEHINVSLSENDDNLSQIKEILNSYEGVYGMDEIRGHMKAVQQKKLGKQIDGVLGSAYENAIKCIDVAKEQGKNISENILMTGTDVRAGKDEDRTKIANAYTLVDRTEQISGDMKKVIEILGLLQTEEKDGEETKKRLGRNVLKSNLNSMLSASKPEELSEGSDVLKLMECDPVSVLGVLHMYYDIRDNQREKSTLWAKNIETARLLSIRKNKHLELTMSFMNTLNENRSKALQSELDSMKSGVKKSDKLQKNNFKEISKMLEGNSGLEEDNAKLQEEIAKLEAEKEKAKEEPSDAIEIENKIAKLKEKINKNSIKKEANLKRLREKYDLDKESASAALNAAAIDKTGDEYLTTGNFFSLGSLSREELNEETERNKTADPALRSDYFAFLKKLNKDFDKKDDITKDKTNRVETNLIAITEGGQITDRFLNEEMAGANTKYMKLYDNNITLINRAVTQYKDASRLYRELGDMNLTEFTSPENEKAVVDENLVLVEACEFLENNTEQDAAKIASELNRALEEA